MASCPPCGAHPIVPETAVDLGHDGEHRLSRDHPHVKPLLTVASPSRTARRGARGRGDEALDHTQRRYGLLRPNMFVSSLTRPKPKPGPPTEVRSQDERQGRDNRCDRFIGSSVARITARRDSSEEEADQDRLARGRDQPRNREVLPPDGKGRRPWESYLHSILPSERGTSTHISRWTAVRRRDGDGHPAR